ncbi:MAG: sigma-70 family RNA polymerase sigma factor [Nocardioidaceae bacterium]|nr:sigma-70 family RNA polymerase sigma factor [Nocardioidaceae bacterium]
MTVQKAADKSDEGSVWEVSARHFRRWRTGEHDALDELVRSLTPILWQVVRSYRLDRDQAEDVVQTTWLTLVRRHESIAEPQAVGAWLMTTARREAWRVAKLAERQAPMDDEILTARLPHHPGVDTEVIAADESDQLWHSVHKLSPRCQRLLRIIAFDDRPDYTSLAESLGMPIGSIGPTRGRCLAKLKDLLAAEGSSTHV